MARDGDPLVEAAGAPPFADLLQPLPLEVLYELGMAPAVRLAAGGEKLTQKQLRATADACWRAVSRE